MSDPFMGGEAFELVPPALRSTQEGSVVWALQEKILELRGRINVLTATGEAQATINAMSDKLAKAMEALRGGYQGALTYLEQYYPSVIRDLEQYGPQVAASAGAGAGAVSAEVAGAETIIAPAAAAETVVATGEAAVATEAAAGVATEAAAGVATEAAAGVATEAAAGVATEAAIGATATEGAAATATGLFSGISLGAVIAGVAVVALVAGGIYLITQRGSSKPAATPVTTPTGCTQYQIGGTWQVHQANQYTPTFSLTQTGTDLTGSFSLAEGQWQGAGWIRPTNPLTGTLKGSQLSMIVDAPHRDGTPSHGDYRATVTAGSVMHGTAIDLDAKDRGSFSWSAVGGTITCSSS